jgi:hypothetical protein
MKGEEGEVTRTIQRIDGWDISVLNKTVMEIAEK